MPTLGAGEAGKECEGCRLLRKVKITGGSHGREASAGESETQCLGATGAREDQCRGLDQCRGTGECKEVEGKKKVKRQEDTKVVLGNRLMLDICTVLTIWSPGGPTQATLQEPTPKHHHA